MSYDTQRWVGNQGRDFLTQKYDMHRAGEPMVEEYALHNTPPEKAWKHGAKHARFSHTGDTRSMDLDIRGGYEIGSSGAVIASQEAGATLRSSVFLNSELSRVQSGVEWLYTPENRRRIGWGFEAIPALGYFQYWEGFPEEEVLAYTEVPSTGSYEIVCSGLTPGMRYRVFWKEQYYQVYKRYESPTPSYPSAVMFYTEFTATDRFHCVFSHYTDKSPYNADGTFGNDFFPPTPRPMLYAGGTAQIDPSYPFNVYYPLGVLWEVTTLLTVEGGADVPLEDWEPKYGIESVNHKSGMHSWDTLPESLEHATFVDTE